MGSASVREGARSSSPTWSWPAQCFATRIFGPSSEKACCWLSSNAGYLGWRANRAADWLEGVPSLQSKAVPRGGAAPALEPSSEQPAPRAAGHCDRTGSPRSRGRRALSRGGRVHNRDVRCACMSRVGVLCIPVGWGVLVMLAAGASSARWGVHALAGVLGVGTYLLAVAPRRTLPRSAVLGGALAGALFMASSLLGAGIDGVLRWHDLGVLRVHPSALLAPLVLVLAAAQLASRPALVRGLLIGVQIVHFLQPDAGQATAFGLGAAALVLAGPLAPRRWACALVVMSLAAATWLRYDPLPPAPFVEDIVHRAFGLTPLAAVLSLSALAALPLAPYIGTAPTARWTPVAAARVALSLYFGGSIVAPAFGEFPVPLLGYGPSPIVGAFLGMAALQRLIRAAARDGHGAAERLVEPRSGGPQLCSLARS
jgi:hypothetical protein